MISELILISPVAVSSSVFALTLVDNGSDIRISPSCEPGEEESPVVIETFAEFSAETISITSIDEAFYD